MNKILKYFTLSSLAVGSIASVTPIVACANTNQQDFWLETTNLIEDVNDLTHKTEICVKIYTHDIDKWYIPTERICLLVVDIIGHPMQSLTPTRVIINKEKNMITAYFLPNASTKLWDTGLACQLKMSAAIKEEFEHYHSYKTYFFNCQLHPHDEFIPTKRLTLSADKKSVLFKFQTVKPGEIEVRLGSLTDREGSRIASNYDFDYEPDQKTIDLTITCPPGEFTIPDNGVDAEISVQYAWVLPGGQYSNEYTIIFSAIYW